VSRTFAVCASERGNRIQFGHIWFISHGKFDDIAITPTQNVLQTIYLKFCPLAEFWKTSLLKPTKSAKVLANQLGSPLPEIRTSTQKKMSETDCGDEKMERSPFRHLK
jgi:hypothetical protein